MSRHDTAKLIPCVSLIGVQRVVDWFEEKPLSFSHSLVMLFYVSYAFVTVLLLNVNHIELLDGWLDGWMDGCYEGWINGWIDGLMDRWLAGCQAGLLAG